MEENWTIKYGDYSDQVIISYHRILNSKMGKKVTKDIVFPLW